MNKIVELYGKYSEIITYLIFGVLTTVVSISVKYVLLFTILEASNAVELQIAVIISWIMAVIFAYLTNRKFVFKSENKNKVKEFLKFTVTRLTTLGIEMFIMWFFITLLKLNSDFYVILFTLITQIIIIIGNYILSKLIVFKK